MPTTTIKVSTELRDRLASRARQENVTLAGAIESALDATEVQAFWDEVRAHMRMDERERAAYDAAATLGDDLSDDGDDRLSAEEAW